MKMSEERIEFGSALISHLEELLKELDTKTSDLDLIATIEYMEYIRGKMIGAYYHQPETKEILAQIAKMNECIETVRKLVINQDASAM